MKRLCTMLIGLCLILAGCGLEKKAAEVAIEDGHLVFSLGKRYFIASIDVKELKTKKNIWRMVNTGDKTDTSMLYADQIVYDRQYAEFEDATDALPLENNVEYRYLIDCGKVFFSGGFLITENEFIIELPQGQ